ncbi:hypothetical protein MKEN_00520700 [Mycena kentingensis (nom. inval.)]|nr:hypothetical protein MKEN_00520700 [Mycena kentingensis (nom. inval.)]
MVRRLEQPTKQPPAHLATSKDDVWTFGFVVTREAADALIPPDIPKTAGARTATIRKLLNAVGIEIGVGKPIRVAWLPNINNDLLGAMFLCIASNRTPELMERVTSESTKLLASTLKLDMDDGLWIGWELVRLS